MNYEKVYNELIVKACCRTVAKANRADFHLHHIVPKSLGGDNNPPNLVLLTHKEHALAHTLLAHTHPNQWFSVEILCQQTKQRLPKWKRRRIAFQRAALQRAAFIKKHTPKRLAK